MVFNPLEMVAGHGAGAASSGLFGPVSNVTSQATNGLWPTVLPSPPELLWAYRSGLMGQRECQEWLQLHGIPWTGLTGINPAPGMADVELLRKAWASIYQSQRQQPGLSEIFTLLNRGLIQLPEAHVRLTRQGWDLQTDRNLLLNLRNELPGPSDLVRFAVRHVFEPDLIDHFGYNDEFRVQFAEWHAKQGLGYPVPGLRSSPVDPDDKSWANAFWWAHWILPSPGQGYSMVQRLRADARTGRPRDTINGEIFTPADLRLLLRANDYPPFWRKKLESISYRVVGVRQLAQMVDAGLEDRAGLIERWQDLGYKREDATLLSDLTLKRARIKRHKAEIGGVKGKIDAAFSLGIIDHDTAAVDYYALTIEDPDTLAVYQAKPFPARVAEAVGEPGIRLKLDAMAVDHLVKSVKLRIASLRKQYLKGKLSADEARAALIQTGIVPDAVAEYLATWTVELDPHRRELTAGQVLRLYREGILRDISALHRLDNMGYSHDDSLLLLAETARSIALDQAKAQVQVARSQAAQVRALQALVAAARTEHNRARSELSRHGTPAQLVRWFVRGLIEESDLRRRLALLDWPIVDIDHEVNDAQETRRKALEAAAAAAAKARQRAGGTATNGVAPTVPNV